MPKAVHEPTRAAAKRQPPRRRSAGPKPRTAQERELLSLFEAASPAHREAILRAGQRLKDGADLRTVFVQTLTEIGVSGADAEVKADAFMSQLPNRNDADKPARGEA
jgi:hypothetical protein